MDGSMEAWQNSRLSSKIGSSHSDSNASLTSAAVDGLKNNIHFSEGGHSQTILTIPDESRAPGWARTYAALVPSARQSGLAVYPNKKWTMCGQLLRSTLAALSGAG